MKRFVFVLLTIAFCSCSPFVLNIKDYAMNSYDLDTAWLKSSSLEYSSDDEFRSPIETEAYNGGDCFDIAAYLIYYLGKDASMVVVETDNPDVHHAVVKYHGKYIEAQIYGRYYDPDDLVVVDEYSYYKLMGYITSYGTRAVK